MSFPDFRVPLPLVLKPLQELEDFFADVTHGLGTANTLPKWNGSLDFVDSIFSDNGSTGNIAGDLNLVGSMVFGVGAHGALCKFFTEDRSGLGVSSNAGARLTPANGTNVTQSLALWPKGTGASSTYKSAFGLWNTDFSANSTNYEAFIITAAGSSGYIFGSYQGGTGVIRPIIFDAGVNITDHTAAGNAKQLYLDPSGRIGINNQFPGTFQLDLFGNGMRSANITASLGASSGAVHYLNSPIPTGADQRMGALVFGSVDGTSSTNCTAIESFSTEAHSGGSAQGSYLSFWVTKTGTAVLTEKMRLEGNSRLTITGPVSTLSAFPSVNINFTSDVDSGMAFFCYSHDNQGLLFDAWHDASNWISSHSGSNFSIYKNGDELMIGYNGGTTKGSTFAGFTFGGARFDAAGGMKLGTPTGGYKGAGTLNAVAVYDDNVLLTDWVFDLHYDGRVRKGDPFYKGQQLIGLDETRTVTQQERRLPWMPTREKFESERSLGGMISRLWQGQEQQQIYIFELEDRIRVLEEKLAT